MYKNNNRIMLFFIYLIAILSVGCKSTQVQPLAKKQLSPLESAKKDYLDSYKEFNKHFANFKGELEQALPENVDKKNIDKINSVFYRTEFDVVRINGVYKITDIYISHFYEKGSQYTNSRKGMDIYKSDSRFLLRLPPNSFNYKRREDVLLLKHKTQVMQDVTPQMLAFKKDLLAHADKLLEIANDIQKVKDSYNYAYDNLYDIYKKNSAEWIIDWSSKPLIKVDFSASSYMTVLAEEIQSELKTLQAKNIKHVDDYSKRKMIIDELNEMNYLVWVKGKSQPGQFKKGDNVCDAHNKMGFIEDANGNKLKVLWVAKVEDEKPLFWFGNIGYDNINLNGELNSFKYAYTTINEIRWLTSNSVGQCSFDI
ncbi:hypothetical protein L2737_01260 [Shewanella electrodiphila]|uniref:Uncharacterized protein n=1 Tax=Shewanella electrodiphila TaxID=934143 RepID=A0ABT0KJF6_9GAMM|nr:hypothetical protein [Shewanella electrodiphila]MCL1043962.1 hypothetical protein [Shewanella electrodiphila]